MYCVAVAVYIMVIHFALAIKNEFNIFLMVACFIFTGVIGLWMHSPEMGFVGGVILTLILW